MTRDHDKTRDQLLAELTALRRRVAELEEVAACPPPLSAPTAREVEEGAWVPRAGVERPDVEEALRFQADIINQISDRITIYDLNDRILFVNDADARAMKMSREEVIGQYTDIYGANPQHRSSRRERRDQCLATGSWRGEVAVPGVDDAERTIDLQLSRILDQHGNPTALCAISRDISERKRAEAQRDELQLQLAQSQKMEAIGNLAGGVAHDMNNVLAAIMGLASVIQLDLEPGSPLAADLRSILAACGRGQDLTRNLLGFARKSMLQAERISIGGAVREALELLKHTIPKQVTLHAELDHSLSDIEGDAGQINHLLINLAINAVDAMEGRGTLTLAARDATLPASTLAANPSLEPGTYVRLQVKDTGKGMDPQTLERAFEPFFTTKPQGKGTGLGLSMVYGTVKSHGGLIDVVSAPGAGTTVSIHLPAYAPVGVAQPDPSPRQALALGEGTVLLVDDEEFIRSMAKRMLERLGYSTLIAHNGREALEFYRTRGPEISFVILDLAMPEMDGPEAFEALLQMAPSVRVIISSGFFKDGKVDELISRGALGFIQKPYTMELLVEGIAKALKRIP